MSTTLTIFLSFLLVYFSFLSETGLLERRNLSTRLASLQLEVERLQTENQSLVARRQILKNDEKAIRHEARKYYLLARDFGVIKFKEPLRSQIEEKVLIASQFPHLPGWKDSSEAGDKPPLGMVKAFYIMTATLMGIGLYMKLKSFVWGQASRTSNGNS
ncbi:MAG: septum formation initiator family protein [Spirochaetota bacterium]